MKKLAIFGFIAALACAALASEAPAPFAEYHLTVEGLGAITVIDPAGEPGYRVRLASGSVTAFPAHSGAPSQANAASDIAHALANPPPAPVPAVVSRRQLLLALFRGHALKEADLLSAIAQIPDAALRYEAEVEFGQAGEFRRDHPLVATLAAAFGLNGGQVDTVFRNAAAL